MSDANRTDDVLQIGTLIKRCPCCAGRGILTQATGAAQYGIHCTACPLTFPEVYRTPESAITGWSLRRGTVSAAGGRGTRNTCSWRKRRACRRNLKSARERKKVKLLKTRLLVLIPWVQALRSFEWAETDEQKTRAWSALKAMEAKVASVPSLRPFCKMLHRYAP
jgi:hypothetical protein